VQEVDAVEPQNSATRKLAENQILFCTRLDHMDSDLVSVGRDMILGFAALSSKVDAMLALPPMRRREDSSHAIEELSERVGETARAKAQQIVDSPDVELTPDVVKDMMQAEVRAALKKQKEDDRVKQLEATAAKVEADRLAAIEDGRQRGKEKRDFRRNIIVAIVGGLFAFAGVVYGVYMEGRTQGHGEGVAEQKANTPAVVPMPMLLPASSMAGTTGPMLPMAVPPTAPAAVAPRHP
jgi:hypothetical protein